MRRLSTLMMSSLSLTGCLAMDASDLTETSWPSSTSDVSSSTPGAQQSPGPSPTTAPSGSPGVTQVPDSSPTLPPGTSPRPSLPPGLTETPLPVASPTPSLPPTPIVDLDEDGWSPSTGDCNDLNSLIHPNAQDVPYDGIDQDCSGADQADVDADGFTASQAGGPDCNDADPAIHPGVDELCDGLDNDCDGQADPGAPIVLYPDLDGDTFGDPDAAISACFAPDGYVLDAGDCDDGDASVYPGAVEVPYDGIDQDCLAGDLEDMDQDGYDAINVGGDDCNDQALDIHPGALEQCDGLDNDCDGVVDEAQGTYYPDADQDGYGASSQPVQLCGLAAGYVLDGTDCNDQASSVYPGATEISDALDNNCDGQIDQVSCKDWKGYNSALTSGTFYIDPDKAGAGTPFQVWCDMSTSGGGWTLLAIVTNQDGVSWGPTSAYWVDDKALGNASVISNADAKSRAYHELGVDELLISRSDGTREVQTTTGCLSGRSMRTQMQVDSSKGLNCARSCDTVFVGGPFASDYWCQDDVLRFRCRDANSSTSKPNGYLISNSDNSFITTLYNDEWCYDYSMGMGVSEYYYGSSYHADFGGSIEDVPAGTDKTARLLFGR